MHVAYRETLYTEGSSTMLKSIHLLTRMEVEDVLQKLGRRARSLARMIQVIVMMIVVIVSVSRSIN